ncbi:MAG TPA: uroporphyrinogen decarboxylase family protein [Armatimonadota bacterium]|nr:uroporphyrinogen decarboxylase family protein [Armatimonadota bacterium]
MTSRERVTAALRHVEPDRTPVFEYVLLPPVGKQILGRPCCDYVCADPGWPSLVAELGWEHAVRRYAADRVELAVRLGHDLLYVVPAPPPCHPTAPPVVAQETDDPVERMRRRTCLAKEYWAPPNQDSFLVYQCLQEEMGRQDLDLPILAPAYAHGVWTDVDLMQALLLAPEIAHQHFGFATRSALALIEQYLRLGIAQIGVGGDFSGTRPLISPHAYRSFIVPEVRTLSRRIHAAGGWAVNASDGDLWPVIEDFLIGCEVDGYLEIDESAGMDMRRLKAAYGSRITFYGNMDCGSTLSFGTPDAIRQATRECLSAGLGDGGHVFCASNAITESVSLTNYLAMVNAYREFWGLAAFE